MRFSVSYIHVLFLSPGCVYHMIYVFMKGFCETHCVVFRFWFILSQWNKVNKINMIYNKLKWCKHVPFIYSVKCQNACNLPSFCNSNMYCIIILVCQWIYNKHWFVCFCNKKVYTHSMSTKCQINLLKSLPGLPVIFRLSSCPWMWYRLVCYWYYLTVSAIFVWQYYTHILYCVVHLLIL